MNFEFFEWPVNNVTVDFVSAIEKRVRKKKKIEESKKSPHWILNSLSEKQKKIKSLCLAPDTVSRTCDHGRLFTCVKQLSSVMMC